MLKEYLKTLKIGDTINYYSSDEKFSRNILSTKIIKITPKRIIRCENGLSFLSDGWAKKKDGTGWWIIQEEREED